MFRAEELNNYGLLTVDSNLIYSIVDVLLGGRRGTAAMRIEGRPYTTIERVLVQRMVEVVLGDAKEAFEPLTPVTFTLDRLETNPRFAAIARPANAAILVKLRIDMEDRGGRIELLLPYATLEPIRKMLLQQFMGEKFGRDNIWESHLATELWTTNTEVRAVLDEQQISLRRVLDLKVGDTLMLKAGPDSLIELRAGTIPLTRGRMGRRKRPHRRPRGSPAFTQRPASRPEVVMSLIAIGMNLLLAALLVAAMVVGLRLNKRLKALRDSHEGFEAAVRELNVAAVRAEQGLADLRAATDEATDMLSDRIEKGRALAAKLEKLVSAAPELPRAMSAERLQPRSMPSVSPAPRVEDNAEQRLSNLLAMARSRLAAKEAAQGQPEATPSAIEREPLVGRAPLPGRRIAVTPDDDLFEDAPSAFDRLAQAGVGGARR